MRLEKKTMATLIAAILIAMIGVMPALADNPVSVPLTVNVVPIVSIQITYIDSRPYEPLMGVDFGTLGPGDSPTHIITIENNGNIEVDIDSTETFTNPGTLVLVNTDPGNLVPLANVDDTFYVTIDPAALAGTYTGTITYTATAVLPP